MLCVTAGDCIDNSLSFCVEENNPFGRAGRKGQGMQNYLRVLDSMLDGGNFGVPQPGVSEYLAFKEPRAS